MSLLLKWLIISGFFLVPVAFKLSESAGKPVEMLFGDGLFLLFLVFLVASMFYSRSTAFFSGGGAYFLLIAYGLFVASVSAMIVQEYSPFISLGRFYKSTLIFLVGLYFGRYVDVDFLYRKMAYFSAALVFLILLSDIIFNPVFPGGRWGGYFFDWEVYGFPNAAVSFYAVLGVFIYFELIRSKSAVLSLTLAAALFLLGSICLLSLSRNALFTYVLMLLLSSLHNKRAMAISGLLLLPVAGALVFFNFNYIADNDGLVHKLESMSGDNPLSSRDDVWLFAYQYIIRSPLFGYGFYSFGNLGFGIGTLHNFFLDVIYKMGLFGLGLYLYVLFKPLYMVRRIEVPELKKEVAARLRPYRVVIILCLISGLTQESLSYSLMQLLVFFMAGFLVSHTNRFFKNESFKSGPGIRS